MNTRLKWLIAIVGFAVVASMLLAGFAESTPVDAGPAKQAANKSSAKTCTKQTRPAGTVRYSDWQFPDTLNPYQTTLAVSQQTQNGMFETLFMYNNKARLVPQMAREMPTVKNGGIRDGGKTYVVHLKKGMRWSNGAEITSKDVQFGWKVGMDKATGPACSGSCDVISRIDTPDKYTVVFHLKRLYAPFLAYGVPTPWPTRWAGAWNNDAHAAAVKLAQDPGFNFTGPNYPTNGPYQVAEFVKDNRIVLQPMKQYRTMACGAAVKNLIFAFYSSKPSMIAAAAAKQTDVTQDYTAADLPELTKHRNAYRLFTDPGFNFEHLEFNLDSTYKGQPNPLGNPNVRLALALALDKIGLIRSALGVNAATANNIASWTPLVNTPALVQPFADKSIKGQWDPIARKFVKPGSGAALQHARQLLARTQWKDGFTVDFYTTSGNPVRQAQVGVLTANWARIGVKVNPNYVPASKLFANWEQDGTLAHGQFQVAMFAFLGSPDPDQLKYNLQGKYVDRRAAVHADINGNYGGVRDPLIDRAFDQAARTLSTKQRRNNYAFAQLQINKSAYWVGLYFRPQIATASDRVVNFSNNPTQTGPTWNMFAWKVKGAS